MHISCACMQDVYKRIHASRGTLEGLAADILQHTYVSIHVRRDVREALVLNINILSTKSRHVTLHEYRYSRTITDQTTA